MQGKDKHGEGADRTGGYHITRRQGEQRAACAVASIGAKRGKPHVRSFVRFSSTRLCIGTVDGRLATGLSGVVNPKSRISRSLHAAMQHLP